MRFHRCLATFVTSLIMLVGCVNTGIDWDSAGYTVRSGDTLYSIAWRYEIDHEDLAIWNQLSSPYIIHPGDRLRTRAPSPVQDSLSQGGESPRLESQAYPVVNQQNAGQITVKPGDTLYSLAKKNYMPAWKLAMLNDLKEPYALYPGQTLNLTTPAAGARPDSARGRETRPAYVKTPDIQATTGNVSWRWPVRGRIIGKFNRWKNDAKGIDIAGKSGTTISAAAAGKVVYSGNSLINYGHLVIIKHSRDFLSAYAHNRRLLVSEGEMVEAGQKIAELGDAGAKTPFLHFEIRKKGKPVDPLDYLPSS